MHRAPSPRLGSPRALLARYHLRPKHSWGQNFLNCPQLAAHIAQVAVTPPGGTVIEIGAGLGALTVPLLAVASRVVAVERDRDMAQVLRKELAEPLESGRLVLIEADAKGVDYGDWLASGPLPRVVTGSLPYQLTGALLTRIAAAGPYLDRAALLVQLEVAERIVASPGCASYGALSVFLQAQFETRKALSVKRGAFFPQPRVDSALIVLLPRRPAVTLETQTFRSFVLSAFQQRRKKLRNAWARLLRPEALALAAAEAGIDLDQRGEVLSAVDFARMAQAADRLDVTCSFHAEET
ncbi:16S rRNA (adenine(1518)-N(6)/adenine(1519)-N(6))-dimethyltransferase RsmA [Myxococcota bacterium]